MKLEVFESSVKSWQFFKYFQPKVISGKNFLAEFHLNLVIQFNLQLQQFYQQSVLINFSCMAIPIQICFVLSFFSKINLLKISLFYS